MSIASVGISAGDTNATPNRYSRCLPPNRRLQMASNALGPDPSSRSSCGERSCKWVASRTGFVPLNCPAALSLRARYIPLCDFIGLAARDDRDNCGVLLAASEAHDLSVYSSHASNNPLKSL